MKNKPENITNNNGATPLINPLESSRKRFNFSVFSCVLLVIVCYVCVCRISGYYSRLMDLRTVAAETEMMEEYIKQDSETWGEISRYARNLNAFFIYHRDFYSVPDEEKVTEEDMLEDIALINQNLSSGLAIAAKEYNSVILDPAKSGSEKIDAEIKFYDSVNDLMVQYGYDVEASRATKLRDKISNYFAIENYLDTTREFTYFIDDAVLERSFSNVVGSDIESYIANDIYISINLNQIDDTHNGIPLSSSFSEGGITGFIMIPKAQPAGSTVQNGINRALSLKEYQYSVTQEQITKYAAVLVVSIILLIVSLLWTVQPKRQAVINGFSLIFDFYLKFPVSVKAALSAYSLSGIAFVFRWPLNIPQHLDSRFQSGTYVNILLSYVIVTLFIFALCYFLALVRGTHRFSDEYEYKFLHKFVYDLAVMRKVSPTMLPLISAIMVFAAIGLIGLGFYYLINLGFVLETLLRMIICFAATALICFVLVIFTNYVKLSYYIKNIAEGTLVDIPEESGRLSKPINTLNSLSEGLKISLAEMVSAERTKTELITNVSHDLKTPLTSIINYVSLLKESKIDNGDAKEYIEILEQKSERLRILIEDLFEASKLSNHSMTLNYEPIDVVQLLTQAMGEVSEKFENKNMDIRFKSNGDKIILSLDGQRIWRVFENLLNNMANYSPDNSRAYINIDETDEFVEITMKNISSFELDFEAKELFERFKRGDPSRTTEGSGLGLSISKNIIELHHGKMDIVIDGDLFKVVIILVKQANI